VQDLLKSGQSKYEQVMAATVAENAARKQRAMAEYMQQLNAVSQSNQDKVRRTSVYLCVHV
jgi:hypothetical protein